MLVIEGTPRNGTSQDVWWNSRFECRWHLTQPVASKLAVSWITECLKLCRFLKSYFVDTCNMCIYIYTHIYKHIQKVMCIYIYPITPYYFHMIHLNNHPQLIHPGLDFSQVDFSLATKKYQRSSAGKTFEPSEVRSPETCLATWQVADHFLYEKMGRVRRDKVEMM